MSDSPQFPPPNPASVQAPTYQAVAPANGYAPATQPPRAPWSSGRKALLIGGIVAAGVGLLTGLVAGTITLVNTVVDAAGEIGPIIDELQPAPVILPPIEGPPGSAVAVHPDSCPEVCFSGGDVAATLLDDAEFDALGVDQVVGEWGDVPDSGVQAEYGYSAGAWVDGDGTPDECFVTYISAPIAVGIDSRPEVSSDSIHWTGGHQDSDGYNSVSSAVRVASESDGAVAHMASLDELLSTCDHYEIGHGADYWSADVTRAPQLTLPDNVAAVGWVEAAPYARYYSYDLQRSNLIVRVSCFSDGSITEADFRGLVEKLAVQLSTIDGS